MFSHVIRIGGNAKHLNRRNHLNRIGNADDLILFLRYPPQREGVVKGFEGNVEVIGNGAQIGYRCHRQFVTIKSHTHDIRISRRRLRRIRRDLHNVTPYDEDTAR